MMSLIVQALTAICVAPAVGAAYAASPKSDRSGAKAKRTANGCIAFRPASEAGPLAVAPSVAGPGRAPAAVRAPRVVAVAHVPRGSPTYAVRPRPKSCLPSSISVVHSGCDRDEPGNFYRHISEFDLG